MKRLLLMATLALAAGCQAPKEVAQSEIANVSDRAKSIESRSQEMAPALPEPLQKPNAENIEDAKAIQASALAASAAVGNTENPETTFRETTRRLTIIVVVLGAIYVLYKLTPLLRMFGLLVPKVTRMDAKFDAEAVVSGTATPHQRESIAANRVADRAYDREFKRQKKVAMMQRSSNPPPAVPAGKEPQQ